jgi:hypothetical protein
MARFIGLGAVAALLISAAPGEGEGDAPPFSAPIQVSESNLAFVESTIDGRPALALIDSGSFRGVQVSSTLAESLKLPLAKSDRVGRRYQGKEQALLSGRVGSLKIGEFEGKGVEVEVAEGTSRTSRGRSG